ncbi:MAG TPA: peptidylprolyl isomerase [Paracoccaceae bacterium]|nr:peptidylprolyl isomerase [Paracoccaceae bacterium]
MNAPLFPDVKVNGTKIPAAAIAAEAQNHDAPKNKPGIAWRKAARALLIRALLLEDGAARGIVPNPQECAPGKFETEEEALIREVLEIAVQPEPASEGDLKSAYSRAPDAYRAPNLYQPAHILFPAVPDNIGAKSAMRAHAEEVLATLLKSPHRFAEYARNESACPSRESGGQLGQLSDGETVPEFEATLRIAVVGEIHPTLVETRFGFHILRLDARAEGANLPFEAVRERLAEACEKAAWAKAARTYVEGLVAKADIQGFDLAKGI